MKLKYVIICLMAAFAVGKVSAQQELTKEVRRYVKKGNRLFRSGNHDGAVVQYKKALETDSTSTLIAYNLGTAMFPFDWKSVRFENGRDSAMLACFLSSTDTLKEKNPVRRSMAFHNAGVVSQVKAGRETDDGAKYKGLQKAIEYYKMALRNNPSDEDARYNLVLCMRQLPKNNNQDNQQQGGGGGGGDDQEKKDEQQQEQQPEQQQQEQQQQQPQQQDEQQQQQPDKDWMEQMLNAADQKEKQTRRRLDEQQQLQSPQRRRLEKNW